MRLEVLGCHGGELPHCRSTCFLLDGVLALDAGSLTRALSLDALCKVNDVLVSHSHFDHVKDLPLLADLLVGRRKKPVTIHASNRCAQSLVQNMFNDSLWPDFTKIPSAKSPIVRIKPFRAGASFRIGAYQVTSIPVNHPVESCGFVIRKGGSALGMSGDTGPTDKLWDVLNHAEGLKVLLLETSFPNRQQKLADLSGHLTPRTLERELSKLERDGVEVLLYHLKPGYVSTLKKEVAGLPVQVLELGDQFEF